MKSNIQFSKQSPFSVGRNGSFKTSGIQIEECQQQKDTLSLTALNMQGKDSGKAIISMPNEDIADFIAKLSEFFNEEQRLKMAKQILRGLGYHCIVLWHLDDVLSNVPDWLGVKITPERAEEILSNAESNHDANQGVTWETLRTEMYNLFTPSI